MTNEQSLFLVTSVSTQADGFVGRLYLTAEQAQASVQGNELVQPVVIRDAAEPEAGRCPTCSRWLEQRCPACGPVETAEPPASRSVQRRVAAMKGEPAPTFGPKEKLICGKCGWHSESDTALFCSHCGKPLPGDI